MGLGGDGGDGKRQLRQLCDDVLGDWEEALVNDLLVEGRDPLDVATELCGPTRAAHCSDGDDSYVEATAAIAARRTAGGASGEIEVSSGGQVDVAADVASLGQAGGDNVSEETGKKRQAKKKRRKKKKREQKGGRRPEGGFSPYAVPGN